MENRLGAEKSTKLMRHMETKELAKADALEIMHTIYPDIPDADLQRAVGICVSFKLNPLMNHLYMVKFQKNIGTKEKPKWIDTWQPILAADATRLMASRSGPISYGVDDTPRFMTKEEQLSRMGQSWDDRLWVIYKVKDPRSGATATGFGFWLNKDKVRGADLGNSAFNMASKRAEIQAVKKLRPAELPENIRTMDTEELRAAVDSDDGIIEGEYTEVTTAELPPAPPADSETGVIKGEVGHSPEPEVEAGPDGQVTTGDSGPPAASADGFSATQTDGPTREERLADLKTMLNEELDKAKKEKRQSTVTAKSLVAWCNNEEHNWGMKTIDDLSSGQIETVIAALGTGLLKGPEQPAVSK